eukprot:COSAG05_NODE_2535_length_2932_cov_3.002824_2_plen_215_part_00
MGRYLLPLLLSSTIQLVVHLHFDVHLLDTHDRGLLIYNNTQYFVARLYFLCRVSSHPVPWSIPLALARTLVDPVHPVAMLLAALLLPFIFLLSLRSQRIGRHLCLGPFISRQSWRCTSSCSRSSLPGVAEQRRWGPFSHSLASHRHGELRGGTGRAAPLATRQPRVSSTLSCDFACSESTCAPSTHIYARLYLDLYPRACLRVSVCGVCCWAST